MQELGNSLTAHPTLLSSVMLDDFLMSLAVFSFLKSWQVCEE